MSRTNKTQDFRYPGKLLLFGEYIIIKGGSALAMPLEVYGGQWQWAEPAEREAVQQLLPQWAEQLEQWQAAGQLQAPLDLPRFREELERGLYFDSSIPAGYGAGSSGALCAALLDRFAPQQEVELGQLKVQLAQLEGFFHGSSSGIDPLICYVQQPILQAAEQLQICTLPPAAGDTDAAVFLIDTAMPRKTGPLVAYFLAACKEAAFEQACNNQLLPANEQAIQALLAGDQLRLLEAVAQISAFQYQYFDRMIPEAFRSIWAEGLDKGLYHLKLCGAGGGGFILGFSKELEKTREVLSDYQITKVLSI